MLVRVDSSVPNELFPQLAVRMPILEALRTVVLLKLYNLVRPSLSPFFFLPMLRKRLQETLLQSSPLPETFTILYFLNVLGEWIVVPHCLPLPPCGILAYPSNWFIV